MADNGGLTAVAMHNALATVVVAYGAALTDKDREIALLRAQNTQVQAMLEATAKQRDDALAELEELRKG
jgi:hypothetical protein